MQSLRLLRCQSVLHKAWNPTIEVRLRDVYDVATTIDGSHHVATFTQLRPNTIWVERYRVVLTRVGNEP